MHSKSPPKTKSRGQVIIYIMTHHNQSVLQIRYKQLIRLIIAHNYHSVLCIMHYVWYLGYTIYEVGWVGHLSYVSCIRYGIQDILVKLVGYVDVHIMTHQYNTSLAAPGALAHRLQCHTACKFQIGRQGAPKWQTGSGKVCPPRFLGTPVHFH